MRLGIVAICGLALQAQAQVEVPHVFEAGTTAKASEVNENFDALEAAAAENAGGVATNANSIADTASGVDANAAEISANTAGVEANTDAVDGNAVNVADLIMENAVLRDRLSALESERLHVFSRTGEDIGLFASFTHVGSASNEGVLIHISEHDKFIVVDADCGPTCEPRPPRNLMFELPDCQGEPFINTDFKMRPFVTQALVSTKSPYGSDIPNPLSFYSVRLGSESVCCRMRASNIEDDGSCQNHQNPDSVNYTYQVDLFDKTTLNFEVPIQGPLSIRPASSSGE